MGNGSGKNGGEGSSEEEGSGENSEKMAIFYSPLKFSPQVPTIPLLRSSDIMAASAHNTTDSSDEKLNAVMITWSYGGNRVAVTGSWDNWCSRERLHKSGNDFVVVKTLPSSVFRYRFIVDEHLRYAPELPWECDESGIAYNILDVQDEVSEAVEILAEFETPSSPITSYNNGSVDEIDFRKEPPDMPQKLQLTLLNDKFATESDRTLPRPQNAVLNHMYIQNNQGQPVVALGSTFRFHHKYVTVVLYKPSR
ncbi:SNF1-related protein kinase regulatory subunit beta-2-like isoform X2 [Mercurialis annua]|nr:SNF1-related protein kinase regulatory subunit beta-2-like isoform X2 [Mercurialis annua]XP_050208135.1 SNF1-related protein kinase regulatory subunit beta-2-like isoform X2 [Mercurialis annua]